MVNPKKMIQEKMIQEVNPKMLNPKKMIQCFRIQN